jgi:uncharacterized protein (DUF2141 family)
MVNFGDQPTGTVGGTVFNDLNGNGRQDAGEAGIAGVIIQLVGGEGTTTTTTDNSGVYRFTNVQPDIYTVVETDPDGYFSTTPNEVGVSVAAGGSARADFGDQQAGTVSGVVFEDLDGNGAQDAGEPGIADVLITLTNGVLLTVTTDLSGTYQFPEVVPGVYTVIETDPSGYFSSTPNSRGVSVPTGGSASANFGDQRAGTISGVVFDDLNGNGIRDANERGIGGVLITLSNGGTRTALTDGEGRYSFSNVTPGAYTVIETDPAYYSSTTPNSRAVSLSSGGSATANFGDQRAGTISGVVFNDLNGNGIQDAGEPGIGGVRVILSNGQIYTATTGVNGFYIFVGVIPGAYTVIETDPDGYVSTTPNSRAVSVAPGGSATANFGDQQVGIVSGVVFNDLNGNGAQDAGEVGIGGVVMKLINGTMRTTTTAGNGFYSFADVAPGTYTVQETDPDGYVSTTPNSRAVSVASGGSATANFGDQQAGTVSGVVFNDLNGNGAQDAGEVGIGGVVVKLINGTTRTTTTAGNGFYSFADVASGAYTVQETDPEGYVSTTPNSRAVSVASGGSATANFGDQQAGTVSGVVFNDLNGNGTQDAGEVGIGGIQVALVDGTTRLVTTAGDGSYVFAGVTPGAYTVQETDPPGFVSTTLNAVAVSVAPGGSATANFGDQPAATISGVAFNDLTGNGVQDAGEAGLGGIAVTLRRAGAIVVTTTTAGNGSYVFTDLTLGQYQVCATALAGFVPTTPTCRELTLGAGGSATANFGFQETGSVSGTAFNDLNGNGSREAGEAGIGSVLIELRQGGITVNSTTTSGDGAYILSGLIPGQYELCAITPAGFAPTTPTCRDVLLSPGSSASANFGFRQQGTISGMVFNDINGNGVFDAGELGIGGATIQLWDSLGQVVTTTTTSGDGAYIFENVAPGDYGVIELNPPGFVSTSSDWVRVTLAANGSATANFGDQRTGTVSGIVFEDRNGNGIRDSSEPGIGGVAIALDSAITTTTAGNGIYLFSDIAPGNHTVTESDPAGYTSVTPNSVNIFIFPGGSSGANFGDQRVGTVSGVVYDDLNGNGVQDAGEPGLGGVLVELRQDHTAVISTTTNADGSYQFTSVTPGSYTVAETDPVGYTSVTPNEQFISLGSGGAATVNFGDRRISAVSGVVFDDANGNSVRDAGEAGLGGVTVMLVSETVTRTVTSEADGTYIFHGVAPGNYTVIETDPAGYVSTTPNHRAVVITAGGSASANFGDQRAGTVSGVVFDDLNVNGVRDAGERGLAGVVVALVNGTTVTATTVSDGSYVFSDVPPGSYVVVETDPAGHVSTTPNNRPVVVATGGSATASFGDQRSGTVSGVKYDDVNGNGFQDGGEAGIGGVLVTLTNGSSRTTTTAGNGSYQFRDVVPGTYVVEVIEPPGYVSVTPNRCIAYVAPGGSAVCNFGDQRVGTVGGVVFDDANGNGARDAGEAGIGGVTVTLSNGASRTTTTTGDGSYTFSGVAPGAYTVVETDLPGYFNTTPNSRSVSVAAGGSASANFGDQRAGTVSGVAFHDLDGDGQYDPGEAGFGRVQIELIDGTTRTVLTSGDGAYLFPDVAPGPYTVRAIPPAGMVSTTPNSQPVSVGDGGSASAFFGFQLAGSVSGVVFNDVNGNGTQDGSESGIGGVQVQLLNDAGQVKGTASTAGNGVYGFSGLVMGRYTVQETDLPGFASTTPNAVIIGIANGGNYYVNFGDIETGVIGGQVFNDSDGNGALSSGEAGIGGVTVVVYQGGTELQETRTNGDGSFAFRNLAPGNYTVVETDPDGFVSSTPNEVTVLVVSGRSANVSYGDYVVGRIYGVVFHDVNSDGVRNPNDSGLGGVLVTLKNTSGITLATVHTSGTGAYEFANLAPGSYRVEETDPLGYVSTTPNEVSVCLTGGSSSRVDFGDTVRGAETGQVVAYVNPWASYTLPEWAWVTEWRDVPLRDVTVELWNSTRSVLLRSTTTDTDGFYRFEGLVAGNYWVHLLRPPYGNSDWWHPVDWWPWEEPWKAVYVYEGGSAVANFRIQYDPCVIGVVFNDLNLDGVFTEGEPAVGGVHIRLKTSDGTVVRETVTEGNGFYLFMDVDLGSYLVEAEPPGGWTAITENPVAIALLNEAQGENVLFGLATPGTGGTSHSAATGSDQQIGTLRGQVRNLNGQGIAGVDIAVKNAQGNLLGQVTTIGNGTYSLSDLPVGPLTVIATDLPDYVSLTSNTRAVYFTAEKGAVAGFVDVPQSAGISGFVFRDENGDGQRNPGEAGIGGVVVQLKQNGQVVQTYTTTVSGAYIFPLVDGVYEVAAANAEDHISTTPDVVRGFGPAVINFGDRFVGVQAITTHTARAVIAGRVYNDANANGVAEIGERPLGGVVVSLYPLAGTEVITTVATTGNGEYTFLDLAPGAYEVVAAAAPGFLATTPTRVTAWAAADGTTNVNFGRRFVAAGHGAVAGRVFNDLDGNGRPNPAEPPLVGVGVRLLRPDGTAVAEMTTAGDGSYLFDVAAGNYRLVLMVPAGFTPTTARDLHLAVAEGQLSSVQFGLLAINTVSGAIFFDTDGDGVRSALERGAGAITVTLRTADGGLVGQTVTSADGYYLFSGLSAGAYTASVILPAGLAATTPTAWPIVLTAEHGATASFGVQVAGAVGGMVFQDVNGNDRLDEGETSISGVRISLTGGGVSRTITTTSEGAYQFFDLSAGIYTVTETDPIGFTSITNTITVTVPVGSSGSAVFGDRPVRTISGRVFHDLDRNGAMTGSESGFGGAEVQLQAEDGQIVATTKALGNGSFEFRDMAAGRYLVSVVVPPGFIATTPEQVRVELGKDDSQAANFGLLVRRWQYYLPLMLTSIRYQYLPLVLLR